MLRREFLFLFILLIILTSCTTVEAAEPMAENSDCQYRLPWSSSLSAVRVSQSINDPDNLSHKPNTWEAYAIDFSLPEGTDILAAKEGTLTAYHDNEILGGNNSSYAKYTNFVVLRHDNGDYSYYGHLKSTVFSEEDIDNRRRVMLGEVIGKSGNTGWSTRPHLHFQIQIGGNNIGPSIPFCFFEVAGGVPKLDKWYISSNILYGQVAQPEELEEIGQPISGLPVGEISFLAMDTAAMDTTFGVQNLTSGAQIQADALAAGGGNMYTDAYDWSADGKKIVNSHGILDFEGFTGESEQMIELGLPEGFYEGYADASWFYLNNKAYVLFVCIDESSLDNGNGICLTQVDEGKTNILVYTEGWDGLSSTHYRNPSLTPDGRTLFFIQSVLNHHTGEGSRVLMGLNTETGESWEVDTQGTIEYVSKLSPDGTKIAFFGKNGNDTGIWIINLDGSGLKQVVSYDNESYDWLDDVELLQFDWSPDGNWIVFLKRQDQSTGIAPGTDIWVVNVVSGKELQITNTPDIREFVPAWRP